MLQGTISQRGNSPFVYRDGAGWPASLSYIRKIRVSVEICTQSKIRLCERVPMVKIWGTTKIDLNQTTGKTLKLFSQFFIFSLSLLLLLLLLICFSFNSRISKTGQSLETKLCELVDTCNPNNIGMLTVGKQCSSCKTTINSLRPYITIRT